jgi:hypothetical protein
MTPGAEPRALAPERGSLKRQRFFFTAQRRCVTFDEVNTSMISRPTAYGSIPSNRRFPGEEISLDTRSLRIPEDLSAESGLT